MEDIPSALLSTNFWPTQNSMNELYLDDSSPEYSIVSLSPSPLLQPELEDPSWQSILSAATDDPAGPCPNSTRKISHNAYERDRRRKLNSLYSSLRALLPETDQTMQKKLSIPSTVARVLKYIPELQRQVERLKRKKEELLPKVLSRNNKLSHFAGVRGNGNGYPAVSAVCLNKQEIMIQLGLMNICNTGASRVSLSRVLRALEGEGLQLMNASSFVTQDGRIFHTLHLQAREAIAMEGQIFCQLLISFLREESRMGFSRHC